MTWSIAGTCSNSRALASLIEVVEAFTIVLAVATLRGWRPGGARYDRRPRRTGRHCPAAGTASRPRPITALRLAIEILLPLFGVGWFRKAWAALLFDCLILPSRASIAPPEQVPLRWRSP